MVLTAAHNNNNISGHNNNNNNNLHHISISSNNQNYHLNTGKVYRQASDEPSVTSILSQKSMDYVRRNSFGDLSTFFYIFFFCRYCFKIIDVRLAILCCFFYIYIEIVDFEVLYCVLCLVCNVCNTYDLPAISLLIVPTVCCRIWVWI